MGEVIKSYVITRNGGGGSAVVEFSSLVYSDHTVVYAAKTAVLQSNGVEKLNFFRLPTV